MAESFLEVFRTRVLPATDTKGTRISVHHVTSKRRGTVAWNYALCSSENHPAAVLRYLSERMFDATILESRWTRAGEYVHVARVVYTDRRKAEAGA